MCLDEFVMNRLGALLSCIENNEKSGRAIMEYASNSKSIDAQTPLTTCTMTVYLRLHARFENMSEKFILRF